MAFVTIPSGDIDVGDPLKKDLFDKIKSNEDDLDSRVTSLEGGAGKVEVFNFPVVNASSASTLTGLSYWRASAAFTLIDAKVAIFEKGSLTGTLEMDIKKNTSLDAVGMTTVFTTKPSIAIAGASDYDESTNAVFDSGQISVAVGDYLRLDMTALPSPVIGKFYVFLIGEV